MPESTRILPTEPRVASHMVDKVEIQNFKSIRHIEFPARRVNLFIGQPNSGKSNILEALSLSTPSTYEHFQELLRFKLSADLYFDQRVTEKVVVCAGGWKLNLTFNGTTHLGFFSGKAQQPTFGFSLHHTGLNSKPPVAITPFRLYKFRALDQFPNPQPGALAPPFGDNLAAVLYSNEGLRKKIGGIFRSSGYRLQIKPAERELLISKDVGDEIYSYPWASVSETLRRVAFYMAILETSQQVILLLDEPEANTFPFYTKYLAEQIALGDSNQFFITTHNPYLLSSVVEKAAQQDVQVFVTRLEDYQTKIMKVPDENLPLLLELNSDVFFNLDRLIEG